MSKKAVIYTRVSTEEQKDNGFSLQEQKARLCMSSKQFGHFDLKIKRDILGIQLMIS